MFNLFQDYFSYTKSKTVGIIGLLLVALLFFFASYLFFQKNSSFVVDESTSNPIEEVASNPNTFDPNLADKATLLKYGLSPAAVENMLRFRTKGGRFHSIESLQKVYGVSAEDYQRIAPFVRITLPQK